MEENRKNSAAQEALQGGECGVVALQQLKNLPHCGNDIIGKEFVIPDIPEAVEDKEVLVKELEKQGVRGSNIQALCIYLAKVFNFENRKDFITWARRVLNADDEGNIEHRATVGAMLNAFKNDPETFVFLMSVPYRKNLVLSSVADRPEFKRFLREKRAEIFKYSRECLVILRNDYFRLTPAAPKQDKAEQLVFDFAGFKTISQAAMENPEKTARSIARKLKKFGAGKFLYGSLTMSAAAVVYLEEHPEELPADLGPYLAYLEELAASLKSIAPDTEK